jgi:hypothetical protein
MLFFTPESGKVKNGGRFREEAISQIESLPELWVGTRSPAVTSAASYVGGTPTFKITYISPVLTPVDSFTDSAVNSGERA